MISNRGAQLWADDVNSPPCGDGFYLGLTRLRGIKPPFSAGRSGRVVVVFTVGREARERRGRAAEVVLSDDAGAEWRSAGRLGSSDTDSLVLISFSMSSTSLR